MFDQLVVPGEVSSVARAAVAILFVVSASAKLARPASTSAALAVLGVPSGHRSAAARFLAVVELAVAGAMLVVDTRVVLLAPTLLLVAFTAFLGHLAYRRSPVACGCLGDLGSRSHWLGLSRNLCLLGLLALAALGDPAAATTWSLLGGVQVAALLIVATEGIYVVHGLRALEVASRGRG